MRATIVFLTVLALNIAYPGMVDSYLDSTIRFIIFIIFVAYAADNDYKERQYWKAMRGQANRKPAPESENVYT